MIAAGYNDRNIHPATRMDHDLYAYSPFPAREPLTWPNGARLAITVVVNVEFNDLILPDDQWKPPGYAAALNVREWSHRDYGSRVGFFRLASILDELGIPATVPMNDIVPSRSPAVLEWVKARGWEPVAHGPRANRLITSQMPEAAERALILASKAAIEQATGSPVRGWLSPLQSQSARTTDLLQEAGFDYTLDWGNDDQPYAFLPKGGQLTSVPYSPETTDMVVMGTYNHTPWIFEQVLRDHFDSLYAEGAASGMAMSIGLHAHMSGEPFRSKYIRSFLEYAASKSGVWFTTGSSLVDAYRAQRP